jgi:hypothetical protein
VQVWLVSTSTGSVTTCRTIDLGSEELYVALAPEIAAELDVPIVHKFGTFIFRQAQ